MGFFDFNNKYGRPILYVWFLILVVSLLPLILFSSLTSSITCDEDTILNGITPDGYYKEKGFTIQEAIQLCSDTFTQGEIISRAISAIFFGVLLFSLKPWPLSNPQVT